VPRHSLLLRAGHGDHRQGQGQLLLALAADRHGVAAAGADRGDPLPLRQARTRTAMPQLPQGPQALRAGLPPLRHRSLPARSGPGSPPGGRMRLWRPALAGLVVLLAFATPAAGATLVEVGQFDQPTFVTSDPANPSRL